MPFLDSIFFKDIATEHRPKLLIPWLWKLKRVMDIFDELIQIRFLYWNYITISLLNISTMECNA